MERRNFFKSMAIVGVSASIAPSSSVATPKIESGLTPGTIVHSVYFWLKDDITGEEEQDFLNFFKVLRKVPGIQSFHVGKPASTTPRPVVDNTFNYSLLVTFSDLDAITTYEKHPDHLAAAEKYSKYWKKVSVRDMSLL